MGILSGLLGDAGGGLIKGVADAADRFIQSPDEKAAFELKKQALDMQAQLQQLDVNKEEAKHGSVFVAGWRPAIGWICGSALAWTYVVQPLFVFVVRLWNPELPVPPALSLGELLPVLLGMLGLGGLRTAEKVKGVNRDKLKGDDA